ncbi:MAG: lysylphosphatidylglycerol synthase transmembrane domain-containing protein [Thiobacillaceae bacterium]
MRRLASVMAIIGVGLAVGAPFALGGGAVLDSLRHVGPRVFVILAGLSIISGVAKAGKLQVLLVSLGHRLPFLRTLAIAFVTDFAFLASPAGAAGYVVNVALLRSAGASWAVSTTVVGAEQALDFVFFAVALPVGAISALLPLAQVVPVVPGSVYVAFLTMALLAAFGLWFGRHFMVTALHNSVHAIPWLQAREKQIGEFIAELRQQMTILINGTAKQNTALLLVTILQWMARYGVLWLVLLELGYQMPFGFVLVVQAVVLHLAQWTGIPAGGGSADLGLAAALGSWVTSPTMATVLLLWRFSTLYFPLIIGALSLPVLTFNWRANSIATSETCS